MKKLAFILVMLFLSMNLQAQENKTPEQKGKEIGSIVKSAIETAVPVWSTISKLIWPEGQNRMNKDDFDEKVKTATEDIKKKTESKFQEQIKPIGKLVEEVSLINKMSEPASLTQGMLQDIRTSLSKEKIDWDVVTSNTDGALGILKEITSISVEKIETNISYPILQTQLKNLIRSDKTVGTQLKAMVKAKRSEDALKKVDELLTLLEPANRVSSFYVTRLFKDIRNLNDWATGGQGGDPIDDNSRILTSFK